MFTQLWRDENGGVVTLEVVLIGTVLGIGLTTGLTSVRDALITELADIAAAVGSLDQSLTITGATSHSSATASMSFTDNVDMGDSPAAEGNSQCLVICNGAVVEPMAGSESGR